MEGSFYNRHWPDPSYTSVDRHASGGSEPTESLSDRNNRFRGPSQNRSLLSIATSDDDQFGLLRPAVVKSSTGVSESAAARDGTPKRRQRGKSFLYWKTEVLLAALILALLCALFLTLNARQNQPLPQWPLAITLNAVLSIYAVVLKSATLYVVTQGLGQLKWLWYTNARSLTYFEIFDGASRGPWGSLQMLWSLHFRNLLASLGALIVMVCLVVDPFLQQTVHVFPCRFANSTVNASLPRTNYFDSRGGHIAAGISGIEPKLRGFIEAVLFAPSSITIPFTCPTSNCTFGDIYHSVGYRSHCVNATSELATNCVNAGTNIPNTGSGLTQNCTYRLSNDVDKTSLYFPRFSYPNGFTLMTSGQSGIDGSIGIIWGTSNVQAARCRLDPVIKSYHADVEGGKLTEQLVSATDFIGTSTMTLVHLQCLSNTQKKTLQDLGYSVESGAEWLPYNGTNLTSTLFLTLDDLLDQPDNPIPAACMYSIHVLSWNSITYFLTNYFSGTLRTVGVDAQALQDEPVGPAQLEALYRSASDNSSGLAQSFENISYAITAHVRQHGNASLSTPAQGIVFNEQTCTHIKWEWISLPAILALGTVLFLVMTILATSKHRIGQDWKLSQYPILFHGLDRDILNRATRFDNLKDMEVMAGRLYVRVDEGNHGWKLTEANRYDHGNQGFELR